MCFGAPEEHRHSCLLYSDDAELASPVADFLREGRALGLHLSCVAVDEEQAHIALAGLDEAPELIASGGLSLTLVGSIYDVEGPVDVEGRLAGYAEATEQALAAGFAGLRVVALGAELLGGRERWAGHTRWENVADRYMSAMPLSALCCYDLRHLDPMLAGDIAAIHPLSVDGSERREPPFRVYSRPDQRVLAGEVDYFCSDQLDRLLDLTENAEQDRTIDLGGLSFIDHHSLQSLDSYRRNREREGVRIQFRGTQPPVSRMAELLEIPL